MGYQEHLASAGSGDGKTPTNDESLRHAANYLAKCPPDSDRENVLGVARSVHRKFIDELSEAQLLQVLTKNFDSVDPVVLSEIWEEAITENFISRVRGYLKKCSATTDRETIQGVAHRLHEKFSRLDQEKLLQLLNEKFDGGEQSELAEIWKEATTEIRFNEEAVKDLLPRWADDEAGELVWSANDTRFKCKCPFCGTPDRFQGDLKGGTWLGKCWHAGCKVNGKNGDSLPGLLAKSKFKNYWEAGIALSRRYGIPLTEGEIKPLTGEEQAALERKRAEREKERRERERIDAWEGKVTQKLNSKLDAILKEYDSDDWRADCWESSVVRLEDEGSDDWRLVLRHLFDPADRIWCAPDKLQSAKPEHAKFFVPVGELLAMPKPLGLRITCCTFPAGCYYRRKEHVERSIYRLLEADQLIGKEPKTDEEREENKRRCWALFRWLEETLKFRFAAIVDTASKSLHGWAPLTAEQLAVLEHIKEGLGLDSEVLANPAMIFRLPGAIHEKTGRPAQLLALNPQIAH